MAVNTISWKTVERWTQGLIDQECREIRAAFVGDGVTAPQVVWSPTEEGLPTPMMRHVHRYWTELRGSEVAPRSEEHTSELQSLMRISYAVFCLKKKKNTQTKKTVQGSKLNRQED